MSQHIQFTMILFFVNMMITFMFPQYTFISTNIYQTDSFGNVEISDNFESSLQLDKGSLAVNSLGIFDALLLVWDFIVFIFGFIFALPVLIYLLPVVATVKIVFFFPILLIYSFVIMGWVRGN